MAADLELAPAQGTSVIGRISRRRMIQGSVAAGVVLSVPVLPLPALADEKEMVVGRVPLDAAVGRPTSDPRTPSPSVTADSGSPAVPSLQAQAAPAQSSGHRVLPVVEPGEFRLLGLAWTGPVAHAAARVRRSGAWSDWMDLEVDPSEGPDPGEGPATGRQVTRPVWIDRADAVEVVVPDGLVDLELLHVHETNVPAIQMSEATAGAAPGIHPRSAWNARAYVGTPSITDDVRLAIVHHSDGSNTYSAADVPSVIRGIQNYHIDAQGWNDIAYNFLVDRFGRIWEGRAGGVDRGVIGGHTYGCNTGTIGVCYLGNLVGTTMPAVAEQSIAALLSWKFNQVHAMSPGGTAFFAPASANSASKFAVGEVLVHPSVVGHQYFSHTACPGSLGTPGRVLSTLTTRTAIQGVSPAAGGPWNGFWLVSGGGQAYPHAWTDFYGSMAGTGLAAPMVSLTPTRTGLGYWMLGADGGIFSFGDARFYGSTGAMRLNRPVVGMARTKSGNGYWLVASDGGVFCFGDAQFFGSTGGLRLNQPVIGMAATPSGRGYWLFSSDGGIFCFGDAQFFGSAGASPLPSPAVGVAVHPGAGGYWLALANGTVRAFGNAPHRGNAAQPSSDPVVGIASTLDGGGYWLAARSGKVISFGNAS